MKCIKTPFFFLYLIVAIRLCCRQIGRPAHKYKHNLVARILFSGQRVYYIKLMSCATHPPRDRLKTKNTGRKE